MTQVSIIVPTFNEAQNILPLYRAIKNALVGINWELIFVDDDSTDGTLEVLKNLCTEQNNVRRIHRISRRGLASACVEGFQSTVSPYLAVIDGDMQHDETKLKEMLSILETGKYDVVLGSRYINNGSVGNWDQKRINISKFATRISNFITTQPISDPMSGFFMITRNTLDQCIKKLSLQGYKLLLDIIVSSPKTLKIKEVAYKFKNRQHGQSKLDSLVALEFILMLIEKLFHGLIPARFILFSIVGTSGLIVHFSVLFCLLNLAHLNFTIAQIGATFIAMTSNFFLNNWLTYFDKRLKGKKMFTGLLAFYAVCSLGSVANVGVATFVFEQQYTWIISGLAGALIGSVWNYAVTSLLAWGK